MKARQGWFAYPPPRVRGSQEMTTDDAETELERIASPLDGEGTEMPARHPIENPVGEDAGGADEADPLVAPHPDEPGSPPDSEDASRTSDRSGS